MKYKIVSYRPMVFFLSAAALLFGGFLGYKKYQNWQAGKEDSRAVWEAMIQTRGQDSYETDEDRKTFFENGDVMVIFPEGHPWSSGEKGELIIKMKITQEEAEKLMESEKKEVKEKEGEQGPQEETVRLRKYRIDLDEIDYDEKKPPEEWKLSEEVFDKGVIEEK